MNVCKTVVWNQIAWWNSVLCFKWLTAKDYNVQPNFKENCKHILVVYIPYMLVIGYPTCDM